MNVTTLQMIFQAAKFSVASHSWRHSRKAPKADHEFLQCMGLFLQVLLFEMYVVFFRNSIFMLESC